MVPLLLVFTGVTFIASGLGKLRTDDRANRFLLDVGVPRLLVRSVERGISLVEVALGCLLLSGRIARWSAGAAAVLAAVFLAAHIIARLRGSSASCGCFGAIDTDLAPALSLVRSAALFGVAAALASSLYVGADSGEVPVGNVQAMLGGVLSCLTYLLAFRLLNEAVALTRHDRERYRRLTAMAAQLNDP
jgi:DoxX